MKTVSVAIAFLLAVCLATLLVACGGGEDEGPTSAASKIAFHSDRDGNYEVYDMNADGSDVTRLTDNPADDMAPAWSP